jgi:hypothetical protein
MDYNYYSDLKYHSSTELKYLTGLSFSNDLKNLELILKPRLHTTNNQANYRFCQMLMTNVVS